MLEVDKAAAAHLLDLQHLFYDTRASFVICELQPDVKEAMDDFSLMERFNYTPTESEAMDIVQMEEIERELDEF